MIKSKSFGPDGLCQCGCGALAPIATMTSTAKGHVKGEPLRFINGHCARIQSPRKRKPGVPGARAGENNPNWKGGEIVLSHGYRKVRCEGHPRATALGHYVYEHILIAESALRKYLPVGAEVHHVDVDPGNNLGRNLVVCQDHAYHMGLHRRARRARRARQ
ncbi:hypothetical protein LCGC14_1697000 [marine sediment metagenome]|uniref:Uncharacterized protein n=1 Tax=marine sediment metagenome TaxID=412755 RepID=A0A0F9HJK4_9ZZZZ